MEAANTAGYLLGVLTGLFAFGVMHVLFGGLILKASTHLIAKFPPPYLRCCLALFASTAGTVAVYFGLVVIGIFAAGFDGRLAASDSYGAIAGVMLVVLGLSLVSGFMINVAILNWLLLRPDGSRLRVGPASLITLVQLIAAIIVLLGLSFGLAVIAGVMPPI